MRRKSIVAAVFTCGVLSVSLSGCCDCEAVGDVADVVGAGMEVYTDAQNAPGAQELRSAGCSNAMVMTPEMFAKIEKTLDNMDADKKGELPKDTVIINCSLEASSKALECDDLAKLYVKAVAPTEKFSLTVNRVGNETPLCQEVYPADFK